MNSRWNDLRTYAPKISELNEKREVSNSKSYPGEFQLPLMLFVEEKEEGTAEPGETRFFFCGAMSFVREWQ